PEGRLLEQVKGVVAEYEREKIRERTIRGRWEKARRGLRVASRAPYGYQLDPVRPGSLLVDESQAAVVRRIFRACVDGGQTIRAITIALQRDGIRPPVGARWQSSTVARILRSSTYAGRWPYGRVRRDGRRDTPRPAAEWVTVPVPAIVDEATVQAAARQLQQNRQRLSGQPGLGVTLLRGLARCGACGRRMFIWRATGGSGRRYRYYRCPGDDHLRRRPGERACFHRETADRVESAVWTAVRRLLERPALLADRVAAARVRLGVREVEVRSEVEHLRRQRVQLGRQIQRLLDLLLGDRLPQEEIRA